MKASLRNIKTVLGKNTLQVERFKKKPKGNGYDLIGFISATAIRDLQNNFHVYHTRKGALAIITPGSFVMVPAQ